jgi:hypothetical protein
MPGDGDGEIAALASVAGLILAMLVVTRNRVRLPDILTTAMSSSLAADGCQVEDVEVDSLSFMLGAARESYKEKQGKDLPKYMEDKVRRWVEGDTNPPRAEGGEVGAPLAQPEAVGAYDEKDRESAALAELAALENAEDSLTFDRDTRNVIMRAMAAQGLNGARLLQLAASLHMGRVVKSSDLSEMRLGCDPGLSKLLKVAAKAERIVLATVIKKGDKSVANKFFFGLARDYASKGMSAEAALISEWWAQTSDVFAEDKARMFEYMRLYFDQHVGLGLPTPLDQTIVIRLIGGAGGAGKSDVAEVKEMLSKQAKKIDSLADDQRKVKAENDRLKKELAEAKRAAGANGDETPKGRGFRGTCNICGEKGHMARDCPSKNKETGVGEDDQ